MSIIQLRRDPRQPDPDQEMAGLEVQRARHLLDEDRETADLHREQRRQATRRRKQRVIRAGRRAQLGKVALIAPILAVNAGAFLGQVFYVVGDVAPGAWPLAVRLALGTILAGAAESIAVLVNWHAHDALLEEHTATAARLRRASYLIAAAFALVNYSHFAGRGADLTSHRTFSVDDLAAPTPLAVIVGAFSLLSPVLWGIHTRRAHRIQLKERGHQDCLGATFSAERFRAFPIRTMAARRWSIEHNLADPIKAWAGYNADRLMRLQSQPASRIAAAWAVLTGRTPIAAQSHRGQSHPVASGRSRAVAPESHAVESHQSHPVALEPSRTVASESHASSVAQSHPVAPAESHSSSRSRARSGASTSSRDAELAEQADPDHVQKILALVNTRDIGPNIPHRAVMKALGIGADRAKYAQKAAQQALAGSNGQSTH